MTTQPPHYLRHCREISTRCQTPQTQVPVSRTSSKGWPHPSLLQRPELQTALSESFAKALADDAASCLNYGTKEAGAWMTGHPTFLTRRQAPLNEYRREVDPATLMSTCGGSMGTDLCCRVHASAGDYAVCEAPTYYLAHQMFRERGLNLREVDILSDGIDLDALSEPRRGA